MTNCPRPLDPIDCEALAAGDEPVLALDAAAHAAGCPACAGSVEHARAFAAEIEAFSSAASPEPYPVDLASKVVRIRSFSRRERRDLRLWAPPIGFGLLLFAAGLVILALPGLSARDQIGLGLGAAAPFLSLLRAAGRSLTDLAAAAPEGWRALSQAVRPQATFGIVSLLLLIPASLALRRVLARAPRRG